LILAQGKKGNNFVVNEDVLQGEEKLGWACLVDEDLMKKGIGLEMGKRQKKERLMKTSFAF
jgi:hypothetical protein